MRRPFVFLAALGAFVALLMLARTSAIGQDGWNTAGATDWPALPPGDLPWTGTYFAKMDGGLGLTHPLPTRRALIQVHNDGTAWFCDQSEMGGAGYGAGVKGPSLGSWVRTGSRQITLTMLCFKFDDAGEPIGYIRLTPVIDWGRDFKTGIGPAYQRVYTMDEDPLNPLQGVPGSLTRITLVRVEP